MAARVITITSGKGGVGKTTATANLGVALASLGNKVVCMDADIGLRNLDVVMGLENRIVYDIVDVVEGRAKLRQAMIKDKRLKEELYLIPAAQTRDKTAVSPSDMVRVCEELKPLVDYILVDSPAGIERGFRNAIAPADDVIIVTNPEVSSVRDADRIIGLVEAEGKGPGYLVINRVKPEMVKAGDMLSPGDIIDILAINLIGLIPEDDSILISTNRGLPVAMNVDDSKSGMAFRNIAKRVMGEAVPLLSLEEESGWLKRVFSKKDKEGTADGAAALKVSVMKPLKKAVDAPEKAKAEVPPVSPAVRTVEEKKAEEKKAAPEPVKKEVTHISPVAKPDGHEKTETKAEKPPEKKTESPEVAKPAETQEKKPETDVKKQAAPSSPEGKTAI